MAPWLLEDVLLTLRSKEAFRRDSRVQEAGWGALAVLAADESAAKQLAAKSASESALAMSAYSTTLRR